MSLMDAEAIKTEEVLLTQAQEQSSAEAGEKASAGTEGTSDTVESVKEAATAPEKKERPLKTPIRVVGVRFRPAGRLYYFIPGTLTIHRGTAVIVRTSRGLEYGVAASSPISLDRTMLRSNPGPILRIATAKDTEQHEDNLQKEREARKICRSKILSHHLEMKLIDAEYNFEGNRIMFYFTADGRVDFRDLVKDLASVFHTRVELRQVGVRDETRILGGYGVCGRPLCCQTYLTDFAPVSIRMAKEQNLSLNPGKISGVCGRLMCCLKNEEEAYEELNKTLPHIGDEVQSVDGLQGDVEGVDILRQRVRIIVETDDEKELHEYDAKDLTIIRRRKRGQAKPHFRREEVQGGVTSHVRQAVEQLHAEEKARPERAEQQLQEGRPEAGDNGPMMGASREPERTEENPREGRRNTRRDRSGRRPRNNSGRDRRKPETGRTQDNTYSNGDYGTAEQEQRPEGGADQRRRPGRGPRRGHGRRNDRKKQDGGTES